MVATSASPVAETWTGTGWTVTLADAGLVAEHDGATVSFDRAHASLLTTRRRWLRWGVYSGGERIIRLRGVSRSEADRLARSLRRLAVADAVRWQAEVTRVIGTAVEEQRWIPREEVDRLTAERPSPALCSHLRGPRIQTALDEAERDAVAFLDEDLDASVVATNERITAAEFASRRSFFDTIEKEPLTDEQARAVVCFDNRVQVLAAAGSGKTSLMVARAAYAVARGFVPANRTVLLAFNRAAADELGHRVKDRFEEAGLDPNGIRADTFHAFGLDVIGQATGRRPRLAKWVEPGSGLAERTVLRIVDELRDTSKPFRYKWDLYRLLFSRAPATLEFDEPDDYDRSNRRSGYRTFGGDVVKSHGERLIADFLFLNGVAYEYERPYAVDVADEAHSQYRPDFYYPEVDVWHEHWAVDRDGNPPPAFHGYRESMAWKRALHAQHRTTLIESTWADVVFGNGIEGLQRDLTALGVQFDWNPERRIENPWARPMKHEDLARFVRTFMTHVKSNSWTREALDRRVASELPHLTGYRTRLFLDIYWPIHEEWERRLQADGSVDFEDMLVQAADHLEAGAVDMPYDLIMVDEFQDASRARARVVRGLVQKRGKYLLAVGDDWQSINRFAGADLSVMTDFHSWFGEGPQLALTTSFRCTQTICDVASAFVSKNPNQFRKPMRSVRPDPGERVDVVHATDPKDAVERVLEDLSERVREGDIEPGGSGAVTVDVLGRYNFLRRDVMPDRVPANLKATFRTVHRSKGLEADYVIVVGLRTGTYGFPSNIADDPVLAVAMPSPEAFAHAEERRLLYVALTRARRGVTLVTPSHEVSPFVVELLQEHSAVRARGGGGEPVEACAMCRRGVMIEKSGRNGPFLGCSRWPACPNTASS